MDENLFEKFSRLTHRGQVPKLLFQEIAPFADYYYIFLVKKGILHGWSSANLPHRPGGKEIREIRIPLHQEEALHPSLLKGKMACFKVPSRWSQYGLIGREDQDLLCGSFPLKYGHKIFGVLLCFKKETFAKEELERIRELTLCASEFSVILPPPKKSLVIGKKEKFIDEVEKLIDWPHQAEMTPHEESHQDQGSFSEARILARLLVNDIKLYHEQDVILGRLKKDLRSRLRREIEKAEKFYKRRIPEEMRKKENFFEKELVDNLAGGDPSALGSS